MDNRLEIISVWEDDDLFEVKVFASNGDFSGGTKYYSQRKEFMELALSLQGFPQSQSHEVSFPKEAENKSVFNLYFKCEKNWKIKVRVKISHDIYDARILKVHDFVEFDMDVEPAAIDSFVSSLKVLATTEIGSVRSVLNAKT